MKLSIKMSYFFLLLLYLTTHYNTTIAYERSDYAPLVITYLPEKLKVCINALYKTNDHEDYPELGNLYNAIQDNHTIVRQDIARKGIEQAITLLKKHEEYNTNTIYLTIITNYLTTYLKGLNNEGLSSL